MLQLRSASIGVALLAALGACGGGDGPSTPVTPPKPGFEVVSGASQATVAGGALTRPIVLKLRDGNAQVAAGQRVSFSIVQGSGSLADTVATTGTDGSVTVPSWTLGKLAGTYAITATSGSFTTRIEAIAASNYRLDVRFFRSTPAADQQQLFANAAARIRGIITGSVPQVNVSNVDLASATYCNTTGLPVMSEVVDGMVVYATVDSIDGRGRTLAQAGGCLIRKYVVGKDSVTLPLVGIMIFDRDDWATMVAQGNLQDVITHEMLHLVGVGRSTWGSKGLLLNAGTSTVAFTGARAIQACNDAQGSAFCASGVPVENTGGSGTADTHWRKTTFGPELMTGYADKCPAPPAICTYPLSGVTIGALQDVGYTVNFLAADSYLLASTARLRLMQADAGTAAAPAEGWEAPLAMPVHEVLPNGTLRKVRP